VGGRSTRGGWARGDRPLVSQDSLVGVLALQGAFSEHLQALEAIGVTGREVRVPRELEGLDGLIIPGGESTAMGRLMVAYGLVDALRDFCRRKPVLGTCAGMVMLSKATAGCSQTLLGVIDATVHRNAFGRQVNSFEADIEIDFSLVGMGDRETMRGVFIRAPWVEDLGKDVKVLSRLGGKAIAVQQGDLVAVAFHPELTGDRKVHRYFLEVVSRAKRTREGAGVVRDKQEV